MRSLGQEDFALTGHLDNSRLRKHNANLPVEPEGIPMITRFLLCVALAGSVPALAWAQPPASKEADFANAHIELASSYFQAGRSDVAVEELQKVLAREPKNSQAHNLKGLIHLKLGDLPKAESEFRDAVASDPGNGDAQNNYGMMLCQAGRYGEGMDAFGRALQSPRYHQIPQTLVNGGICLQQKNDFAGAEKFLIKALEQEPFMPSALYQLAKVYHATGRDDAAASRLSALHQQVAPTAASLELSRQVAQGQGNAQQAQESAKALRARFPQSPEALRLDSAIR